MDHLQNHNTMLPPTAIARTMATPATAAGTRASGPATSRPPADFELEAVEEAEGVAAAPAEDTPEALVADRSPDTISFWYPNR